MAVQDINEAGGIDGRKLEVVMRDSAADPAKAVSFAKELVYNENIDVLCGPINSGEALPTLATVSGAKKLHLIGGSVEELNADGAHHTRIDRQLAVSDLERCGVRSPEPVQAEVRRLRDDAVEHVRQVIG